MSMLKIKNCTIGEGVPKIIVPLVGGTEEEIMREAELVKELKPDAVEWRVDLYNDVMDLDKVKNFLGKLREFFDNELLLFTFRSKKEGGNLEVSKDFYVQLNKTAILTKNIDLVDVELFNDEKDIKEIMSAAKENGVYVIMSNHEFTKTPPKEEIIYRLRKMQEYGADIPKIAVMPNSVEDVLTLLDATNTMKKFYADRPLLTISMGGLGTVSRLAGQLFGSDLTFGAGKEASAPGQIPVDELRKVLEIISKGL